MMCDSHSGTEQARGWKKYFKGVIIRGFDAALVGGKPHERYFESFGMPREYIFTGYDAVDNEYYSRRSADVRDCTAPSRSRPFDLPSRYFLSLGRMVQKKNLPILIEGYEGYVRRCHSADIRPAALVLVGSGEEEPRLRALARTSGLRVVDFTQKSIGSAETSHISGTDNSECGGLVYFYGFRQIAENVVFYALAEAFVLPSTSEEWGLVVNEAMACSLPVVVSRNAGCVEDLVLPRTDGSTPRLLSAVRDEPFGRNLLDERSNGFVFEPTCAEALAEALWSITRADQKDISELGKRSREIVDQYSCENFGRQALLAAIAALRLPAGKPSQTHQRL